MLALYKMQLAMFEAFRRLGFAPEDIFVAYNVGIPVTILRTQGKQFVMNYPHADEIPTDEQAYIKGWQAADEAWNSPMSTEERSCIFTDWFLVPGMAFPLLESLQRKGITWKTGSEAALN